MCSSILHPGKTLGINTNQAFNHEGIIFSRLSSYLLVAQGNGNCIPQSDSA